MCSFSDHGANFPPPATSTNVEQAEAHGSSLGAGVDAMGRFANAGGYGSGAGVLGKRERDAHYYHQADHMGAAGGMRGGYLAAGGAHLPAQSSAHLMRYHQVLVSPARTHTNAYMHTHRARLERARLE